MPRIVPLQLLKCLKVLLDENGGILSESEVKRIAGLMTKYSKKLVSKCIYVQILKCTKTELLGEFMGSGGWSLTHSWLNDSIPARNWPLVQEILELLLLCPVDVERLKSNSAPKLVKGLCKDGDDEGVRILASKLVEQWLKVVTGDATTTSSTTTSTTQMAPKPSELNAIAAPVNASSSVRSDSNAKQTIKKQVSSVEEDPLGETEPPIEGSFQPTLAQKKASESGLVFKCIVKDGKQVWARVENTQKNSAKTETVTGSKIVDQMEEVTKDEMPQPEEESEVEEVPTKPTEAVQKPVEEVPSSAAKPNNDTTDNKENEVSVKKKDVIVEKEKSKDKEKEKEKEKSKSSSFSDKDKKSSSSSHKSSSSSHKSSSSKSSSSSSSSKSKSSSHRSSTDSKSRDKDKEREKDKERSSNKERSSDKDKHRSSSSKSTSNSSSSNSGSSSKDKDRHRDKSSSNSSLIKKDKEKEKSSDTVGQSEKDKETLSKVSTPSIDKLGKIPRKSKDDAQEIKPTSITIPSKKASMSIEIRRDSEKAKTVKTYKSQFRSHGLNEEAPPPPSRKGLKKPNSAPVPGTAIPSTLTLKRASPPPSSLSSLSKDAPAEKKAKIEMAALAVPVVEKIGAIKLIPPKKSFMIVCEFSMVWLLLIMRQLDNGWNYHHRKQQLVRG